MRGVWLYIFQGYPIVGKLSWAALSLKFDTDSGCYSGHNAVCYKRSRLSFCNTEPFVLCQALFQDAWQAVQVDAAPPDVLIGHKALHISAQLAEQAQTAAQGLLAIPPYVSTFWQSLC